jgi:N-acetylglucosamine-6-phosphate deacetylase
LCRVLLRVAGLLGGVLVPDADQQTVAEALAAAASDGQPALVTHLFNAMRPLHHRSPGPVGAALSAAAHGHAVLELIADGVHVDGALAATVIGRVGAEQVAMVTDAMAATGCGDGDYRLGGRSVRVSGGVARLVDAGTLAGGTCCLLDIVRRCVGDGSLSLAQAVTAASATPTSVLTAWAGPPPAGRAWSPNLPSRPSTPLSPGSPADLVVVDAELRPVRVAVAGRWEETSVTPGGAKPLRD